MALDVTREVFEERVEEWKGLPHSDEYSARGVDILTRIAEGDLKMEYHPRIMTWHMKKAIDPRATELLLAAELGV